MEVECVNCGHTENADTQAAKVLVHNQSSKKVLTVGTFFANYNHDVIFMM